MPAADAVSRPPEAEPLQWESRLREVRRETPTVRTFFFDPPPGPFVFREGQYLAVRLPGVEDPRGDSRTFSISSAPSDLDAVSVTTREGPSPFKRQLFASAPGTPFELWGPFGSFTLDPDRPAVLVGGGIGITPFRSMIREAAHRRAAQPIVLLYSTRLPEEIVYRRELDELGRAWTGFRATVTVTHPAEGAVPWNGLTGRLDAGKVRELSRDLDRPLYYICGPPKMVAELERLLVEEAGVAASDVRTELFQGY